MSFSRADRSVVTLAVLAAALAVVGSAPAAVRAHDAAGRWQVAPRADAAPVAPPAGRTEAAQPGERGEVGEAEHGGWVWPLVARLVNFGIMAGTLAYFLRKPVATYLQNRSNQIRRDLAQAEELHKQALVQMAEIAARLKALPGEIEALRMQGAAEIAAAEARLRAAAHAERERLLEHARREIDLQVRIAKQALLREAADLAVGVAAERIKKTLTPDVHLRLVDRYANQLRDVRGLHD